MSKVTIPDIKMFEESGTATVAAGGADILTEQKLSSRFEMMNIEVENTGSVKALDQFILYAKAHPGGSWHILEQTWTTASGWLIIPARFDTTPASTALYARVNVKGLHSVKAAASANTATTTVTVRGSFSG